jgi:hypothetical protein
MAVRWTLGCDAADPHRIAAFWAQALGCVPEPGYADPGGGLDCRSGGKGPAIGIPVVPDGKRAKNRMHLDIRVAGEPPWYPVEREHRSARR